MSVYLRAAESVARGQQEWSCLAVSAHGGDDGEYRSMFGYRRDCIFGHYFGSDDKSRRHARVLALLFMHWMTVNP